MSFLTSLLKMLPDAAAQGLIWGILAIGVFITYKLLDFSDLTVDGSICTGACVCAVLPDFMWSWGIRDFSGIWPDEWRWRRNSVRRCVS